MAGQLVICRIFKGIKSGKLLNKNDFNVFELKIEERSQRSSIYFRRTILIILMISFCSNLTK